MMFLFDERYIDTKIIKYFLLVVFVFGISIFALFISFGMVYAYGHEEGKKIGEAKASFYEMKWKGALSQCN